MNIKKLSFIDISLIAAAVFACAVVFTAARHHFPAKTQAPAIRHSDELIVYPSNTLVKPSAISKAEAKPQVQPAPVLQAAPLPLIPPRVISRVLPEYPAAALAKGFEGSVLLSVLISTSGRADGVEVLNSSGIAELDRAAVSAVAQWKFDPAAQAGRAIPARYEVPVTFIINN